MSLRYTTISVSFIVALLFPMRALAGASHVACLNPFVFRDAAVNLVVLPYDDSEIADKISRSSGTQLALLLQMDALSHILGYGSVGAVQLEGSPEDRSACEVDGVADKLLGKKSGALEQIRPGHGLVLVWGLMYQEGDDVYVQSYARFLRRETGEELLFSGGAYKFTARPTSQIVSFAPRHLSRKALDDIEAAYRQSNVLHREKSDTSPGEELHGIAKCGGCGSERRAIGFLVTGADGDWIRIRRQLPNFQSEEGWIHANSPKQGFELERDMPELSFIEGAVGYLHARFEADSRREPSEKAGDLALQQFANFDKFADRENETVAVAVAAQLAGITRMLSASDYGKGLKDAQDSFDRARQLVPYSSDAITLAAATELNRATLAQTAGEPVTIKDPRIIAQRFAQASALAPASTEAMTNLRSYYNVALNAHPSGAPENRLEKPEIERQLQKIKPWLEKRDVPDKTQTHPTALQKIQPLDVDTFRKAATFQPAKGPKEAPTATPSPDKITTGASGEITDKKHGVSSNRKSDELAAKTPEPDSKEKPIYSQTGVAQTLKLRHMAIAAVYSLPQAIQLSPGLLAAILVGKLTKWNAPEIARLNPKSKLPDLPIHLIPPPEDPALTLALNHYLANVPGWQERSMDSANRGARGRDQGKLPGSEIAQNPGSITILPQEQASALKSVQVWPLH